LKITLDEVNLLKDAVDHYRNRLKSYTQDVDLQKQLQKSAQLFSGKLESEAQRKIQVIQETRLPTSLLREIELSQYPVDVFEEASQQYKEDLSEIKNHVPVGLRKQIEKEITATEDLLRKIKSDTSD